MKFSLLFLSIASLALGACMCEKNKKCPYKNENHQADAKKTQENDSPAGHSDEKLTKSAPKKDASHTPSSENKESSAAS